MFTGIIEHMGVVGASQPSGAGRRLLIDPKGWLHRPSPGDSIAICGCCLTLAAPVAETGGQLAFDVVPETLAKTRLGRLRLGESVNLEHAATASTLLGGHVVQGHVDGVGEVLRNGAGTGGEWLLGVRVAPELMEYMVPKGSVCLDGVSLTLASVDVGTSVIVAALIPTTLRKTTLGVLKAGDAINIEADAMAKTIVHWIRHYGKR